MTMIFRFARYLLQIATLTWTIAGAPNQARSLGQQPDAETAAASSTTSSNAIISSSAIPLLGGFDSGRIDAAYPPSDEAAWGELAKLAYRLRSLDPDTLAKIARQQGEPVIGDAVSIDGVIERIVSQPIPVKLVEYLEMSQLRILDIRSPDQLVRIISPSLSESASVGDRVAATGVVVEASQDGSGNVTSVALAVVCATVRWFPASPQNAGQQLLSEAGFDATLLAGLASRNRRPLLSEDSEAFYAMLTAATAMSQRADLPPPRPIDPVDLLRSPKDWIGQWIHLELESVQVTRIAVAELHRQQQLGRDHYYQLDAVGDLDGVVIKIENADPKIPPAIFQNRYPVSVVTAELPGFLQDQVFKNQLAAPEQRSQVVSAPVRMKFAMDGFFFRLWAYETEFMSQQGGGKQFGPLLVAARLENREPESIDVVGVGRIGAAAAIVVLSGIAWIWWWQRRAWSEDAAARRRRQERHADLLPERPA